jgi:two-component system cell cycle sensor histidine kinase/response regulator CckA
VQTDSCCFREGGMNSVRPEPESFQELGVIAERPADLARGVILVVEDESFVREVTCEVLLSAGYLVLRARTAAEALRLFTRSGGRLQLLLTDVVLPGRSGQMLAQELRTIFPGLKTIFISGYPENHISKQDRQEPGTFYLPKPFSVQMLLAAVEAALDQHEIPTDGETAKRA